MPLRIVFLGSDPIALPLLNGLMVSGGEVAPWIAVYTQPDRPVGRGQKVVPNAIKTWALEHGLPVYQPEKLTEPVRAEFAALGADVALVMAYGHILRDEFIAVPRLGTLNLHASILPKYRGASPIQTAIACGERETGVALMRIVRRLDAGPVAEIQRVPIEPLDTATEVEAKLAAACAALLPRSLESLARGELAFVAQDESAATYCRRLDKDDGALDFGAAASTLAARINGLYPWPACSVEINGVAVKFGLADALEVGRVSDPPRDTLGAVVGVDSDGLLIATGVGHLRVRRMQRPGGRMLPAAEFLRGFPVTAGTRLESRPMPPLVAAAPFKK